MNQSAFAPLEALLPFFTLAAFTSSMAHDPTSLSNSYDLTVTSLHMALSADFNRHVLVGHVDLTAKAQRDGVSTLVLDTRALTVKRASSGDTDLKVECSFHRNVGSDCCFICRSVLASC